MLQIPPQDVLQVIESIVRGIQFSTMLRYFPFLGINIIRLAYRTFGWILLTSIMLKKIRIISSPVLRCVSIPSGPGGPVVPSMVQALIDITFCDGLEDVAYIQGFVAGANDGEIECLYLVLFPIVLCKTILRTVVWRSSSSCSPTMVFLREYTSLTRSDSFGRPLAYLFHSLSRLAWVLVPFALLIRCRCELRCLNLW